MDVDINDEDVFADGDFWGPSNGGFFIAIARAIGVFVAISVVIVSDSFHSL